MVAIPNTYSELLQSTLSWYQSALFGTLAEDRFCVEEDIPMLIMGLDHIQLVMPAGAEAAARSFYGQLLGLEEIAKPEALRSRGGCWFRTPDIQLHLGVEANFAPAQKAHPAFLVSDLMGCQQILVQAGNTIVPDTTIPGVERFYTVDPFGNRLEFIQNGNGFRQQEEQ